MIFGQRACNQMVRDQERFEEFVATNRDSVAGFNDELYFLFPQKVITKLNQFLEISNKLDNTVSAKLERHFLKEYGWIKKHKTAHLDSKCRTFYSMSVYSPNGENNTFRHRGLSYPLRISD